MNRMRCMVDILPPTVHSFISLGNLLFLGSASQQSKWPEPLDEYRRHTNSLATTADSSSITFDPYTCRIATETIWLYIVVHGTTASRWYYSFPLGSWYKSSPRSAGAVDVLQVPPHH
ncbi:hypothetical protein PMIN07_002164 [Paraphaeosphaeria minitans]